MLTNREVLFNLPAEVLAAELSCPNDFYGGIVVEKEVRCTFKEKHDCKSCIASWLDSESTIREEDEEDE